MSYGRKKIPFIVGEAVILNVIFLLLFGNGCLAEEIDAEALFRHGLAQFRQGKYVSARLDFNEIITLYSASKRVTSSYMMLSKTFYNLRAYDAAESTAVSLRMLYPRSRYTEWTEYMIAACRFRLGDTEQAVSTLAALVRKTNDNKLISHALSALRSMIIQASDPESLFTIVDDYGIKRSDIESGVLLSVEEKEPVPPLLPLQRSEPRSVIKIGLLLPLTGMNSDLGNELQKGVNAALSNYPVINGVPVELVTLDTESNPIQAVIKARKLIEEGVIAIIGPVYGESTIAAALESNASGIPFLAPTATDIGLPLIGPYIFQLNQTPIVQAEALADFAVTSLGFDNIAVIASRDWWGETVAESFSQGVERRGGDIIRIEYFEPTGNVYNFNDLVMRIREHAPESTLVEDSIIVFNQDTAFPDTVIVKINPELGPQRFKPITTIDCILISAETEDAIKIASQIKEYNIITVLLGDTGWSGQNVASQWSQYVEGSYLISSVTDISDTLGSSYFIDDLIMRRNQLTSNISRKGYDTCAVLLHCLIQGASDPNIIVEKLESVRDFRGLSSLFTIDPESHMNTAIEFVQIVNGRYVKVNRNIMYRSVIQ